MQKKEYLLNAVFLKNRIVDLGLKQWWLAEQIGVDRKTVSRWINGKVKSIQKENADSLCKTLECQIEDITVQSLTEQLASPEEQKMAAKLITSSSLFEKLGPIGEWDVLESLLKATVVPDLPLNVLGELYNLLTVSAWRQSKIDVAAAYNVKALELGEKSGDKAIIAKALTSQANIFCWRGFTKNSIGAYEKALLYKKHIDAKAIGSIYSNLGATLYEAGELEKGREFQILALSQFEKYGSPMNFCIAYGHISMIELQLEKIDQAETYNAMSMQAALEESYSRGVAMCDLVQAEIFARRSDFKRAIEFKEKSFVRFADLGIEEGLNYEYAGRVYRLLGDFDRSLAHLEKGIQLAEAFPVYQAALFLEASRLMFDFLKPKVRIVDYAQKAEHLYRLCQCQKRVEQVQALVSSVKS